MFSQMQKITSNRIGFGIGRNFYSSMSASTAVSEFGIEPWARSSECASTIRKSFFRRVPKIEASELSPKAQQYIRDWKELDEQLNHSKVNKTFLNYFIRKGYFPLHLFSEAQTRLRLRYQDADPISKAVFSVKPLVYFEKTKRDRVARILGHSRQHSIVGKWIRDDMINRQRRKPKSLTDGFYGAVSAVLDGNSSLFQKKFEMHRAGFV